MWILDFINIDYQYNMKIKREVKMVVSNEERAHVLVQAMPYIQKYAGQTVVVKYGGNAMITPELKSAVMSDIVLCI